MCRGRRTFDPPISSDGFGVVLELQIGLGWHRRIAMITTKTQRAQRSRAVTNRFKNLVTEISADTERGRIEATDEHG